MEILLIASERDDPRKVYDLYCGICDEINKSTLSHICISTAKYMYELRDFVDEKKKKDF